ncbi:MAG: hypothetical protein JKY65_08370, partial [Planctomycetes bacterium]|nr:hypothetical protein [Planctomycetota bacterium]
MSEGQGSSNDPSAESSAPTGAQPVALDPIAALIEKKLRARTAEIANQPSGPALAPADAGTPAPADAGTPAPADAGTPA